MTPKNYLTIIRGQKSLIFICIILCGLLALIFSLFKPMAYESLVSFSIQKVNRQDTVEFQYDNYYAMQASELLGNTVVGWLEAPDTIANVYSQAGLTPEPEELNSLVKKIKAKQISAHLVSVRFSQSSYDRANKVATSLSEVITNKVETVETTSAKNNSFTVVASEPVITEKKYNSATVTLIGLICGALLGVGIAFGREYLKE